MRRLLLVGAAALMATALMSDHAAARRLATTSFRYWLAVQIAPYYWGGYAGFACPGPKCPDPYWGRWDWR
jgi:hypothetical protein